MIDLDSFYTAAGLLPPEEWGVQRLASFRAALFSKLPKFIANEDFDYPNFARGTGKTTKILIEALHAEWHGYDTVIVFKSVVEQYYANYRYETLKRNILSKIGPPLNRGKVTMITRTISNHYEGQKIVWDDHK